MEILQTLIHNKMFMAPLLSWAIAQVVKTIINFILTKKFNPERLIGSGGMPSCHSATVIGLMYATAFCRGIDGFEFPLATTLAIIVMYDAMNVRMETGKQSIVLNFFLKNEEIMSQLKTVDKEEWPKIILKEYVGHTPLQVLGGIITGLIVAYFVCRCL
ncbi:MAG: divergent PAP2 family protein [Lachnospiraceae bacterium]|nr:divergent PAP2 family protein [Lachnospiraceae bacterium]